MRLCIRATSSGSGICELSGTISYGEIEIERGGKVSGVIQENGPIPYVGIVRAGDGLFKGNASIEQAEVRGRFEGELVVSKRLVIRASGHDHEPIARPDVARRRYLAPDNHGAAFGLVRSWRAR